MGTMKQLRELTGMTLSDWREIYRIYQPPRWSKAEAHEMLRNWMLYTVSIVADYR